MLFNIAMADVEEEMETEQGSSTWIGKRVKFITISNADDIALITGEESAMKDMPKRVCCLGKKVAGGRR